MDKKEKMIEEMIKVVDLTKDTLREEGKDLSMALVLGAVSGMVYEILKQGE